MNAIVKGDFNRIVGEIITVLELVKKYERQDAHRLLQAT